MDCEAVRVVCEGAHANRGSNALLDTPMHVSLLASHVARHGITDASIIDLLPVVIQERAHCNGTCGPPALLRAAGMQQSEMRWLWTS